MSNSLFRVVALLATGVAALLVTTACIARDDFWVIGYHTEMEGVAVTHMIIKSGHRILDENYQANADGSLVRYYREAHAGRMPRPDVLDVQWVELDSRAVHEQHIELRKVLPTSLEDQDLRLVFKRDEVYLFLVHTAVPTAGHPVKEFPAPQLFPDPSLRPYVGNEHPISREQPSN